MINPFVYGEAVIGNNFCNRKKEIEKLSRDALNSQKIFLISSRRFGKTSLIKTILEKIRKQKIKAIYLDIEGISTYKKFLNSYLNALVKEYTAADKIYEFAKRFFPGIRFDLKVDETGKPVFSIGYKSQDPDLENIATKIYQLPEKIARRKRMVIVFDEFQEILKLNGKQMEATLRSVIQHQRNVGYIFVGSKRHILTDMATTPERPFYKIGPVMYLDKIPEEEFKKFVFKKFQKTKIKVKETIVEKITEMSENIPYYVQMISHELWDYAIAGNKKIEEENVNFVFQELVKQYNPTFRESWDKLINTKKQILHIIASKGGQNLLSKESLSENEFSYPSSVQRTLELLMADGYIDKVNGEYYIIDILFREWVRQFTL